MTTHCMIDLETLGVSTDTVILSIGAVKFDPKRQREILDRFHVPVDPISCQAFGMKIEAETVMWWMDRGRSAAREKLNNAQRVDLASALEGFVFWWASDPTPAAIWSNGATFDIPIMRHSFKAIHMECPWKYYDERCFRTLKNLVPNWPKTPAAHDALEDAIAQAHVVQEIALQLGLNI